MQDKRTLSDPFPKEIDQKIDKTANDENIKLKWKNGLKILYTNADQFVNKRDDLIMFIVNNEPDVMMITEVIPKNQVNPITGALLHIDGYKLLTNFNPEDENLGSSGIRGIAIYSKQILKIEVNIEVHIWFF